MKVGLAGMVLAEAEGRDDAFSETRRDIASGVKGGFWSLMTAAKIQTIGYWWQNCDMTVWADAGHEVENFGSATGADGHVCGAYCQYKVARLSKSDRRFRFFVLPSARSRTMNVLLFAQEDVDMEDWPVFYGTTGDLNRVLKQLAGLNRSRRTTRVSCDSSGRIGFSVSAHEMRMYVHLLPGFMSLRDYVEMRSSGVCGC